MTATPRTSVDTSRKPQLVSVASKESSTATSPTDSNFPKSPTLYEEAPEASAEIYESSDEDDYDNPASGWPQVATLMAKTPDFVAFSPFRDLNIKSLLYYQTQLTSLRAELHKVELEDCTRGRGRVNKFASNAKMLINSENVLRDIADEDKPSYQRQWNLVKRMRVVLKEYNAALLQYSQITALPEPERHNMKTFRMWIRDERAGNFCIKGIGEENTWGDILEPEEDEGSIMRQFFKLLWKLIWPKSTTSKDLDLVAVRRPQKIDGFTRWIASDLLPFYCNLKDAWRASRGNNDVEQNAEKISSDKKRKKRQRSGKKNKETVHKVRHQEPLTTYSEKAMLKFTSSVSTVLACLLPTVAITVLSKVNGLDNLLLCLAGFATLFSIGLIFLTNGTSSRVEIFTATAAFSAVLVVFIQQPVVKVVDLAS